MQYLSVKKCAERYEVTRQTWWRWVREGRAPSPVHLTPGCTRWKISDLEAWEAKQEGAA
jgi:prophage regulatory protein